MLESHHTGAVLKVANKLFSWASLAVFGNSYLGKVVVLAPVVALYVRYEGEFLEAAFGLTHALWLYWSLIFISVGQMIYFLACPKIIKKYGSDVERFKIEDENSRTSLSRSILRRNHLRTFFIEFGGPLALYDPEAQQPIIPNDPIKTAAQRFRDYILGTYPNQLHFDPHAMSQIHNNYPSYLALNARLDDERVSASLQRLGFVFDAAYRDQVNLNQRKIESREWDIEALEWEYNSANLSNRFARFTVGLFYLVGATYFAYSAVRGVAIMSQYSFGILF